MVIPRDTPTDTDGRADLLLPLEMATADDAVEGSLRVINDDAVLIMVLCCWCAFEVLLREEELEGSLAEDGDSSDLCSVSVSTFPLHIVQ